MQPGDADVGDQVDVGAEHTDGRGSFGRHRRIRRTGCYDGHGASEYRRRAEDRSTADLVDYCVRQGGGDSGLGLDAQTGCQDGVAGVGLVQGLQELHYLLRCLPRAVDHLCVACAVQAISVEACVAEVVHSGQWAAAGALIRQMSHAANLRGPPGFAASDPGPVLSAAT